MVLNKLEAREKELENFERLIFVKKVDVKVNELNGRINTLESAVKDNLSQSVDDLDKGLTTI